ncbi:MAG: hypothetical protein WC841_04280 [Candidatus Shapirobacteria bacterium]|jgi:hypothetical protein
MSFILFLFFLAQAFTPKDSLASLYTVQPSAVLVSASIGENEITVYGYTSPLSKVEMESTNVYSQTYSDTTGYFIFLKTLLPKLPSELCFRSTDDSFRQSVPVCIPPPPETNYHTETGPILLSPTLTIDTAKIKPNSTALASGQAIPDSEIKIEFFKVTNSALSFPKEVQAYSLPSLTTKTNTAGNYEFNLPTAYSSNYRLYTSVKYLDSNSPKSNTLLYTLPSLWWFYWQQYYFFIVLIPVFLLTLFIFFILLFKSHKIESTLQIYPRFVPRLPY